jgi:hypothetical protein
MAIIAPHRAALAVVIFLMAAPAALADPPGYSPKAPQQAAPQQAAPENTSTCCNPPEPGRGFLSSAPRSYWKQFRQPSDRP